MDKPINEEYVFTYDDYIAITQNGFIRLHEDGEEYQIKVAENQIGDVFENQKDNIDNADGIEKILIKKGISQKHDKNFKDILSDKKEMAFFLKEFVSIEIEPEELQEYKTEFITNQYERRQSDIVYKNNEKDIYYIVEHQSKEDKNMPLRMAEYCIELMKDVVKNSNSEFYPRILPIVLYTGNRAWNVKTNFAERRVTYEETDKETYEEYSIDIKYKVVDINKIKDVNLLKKQNYLANIMLMEKCRTLEKSMEMFWRIQDYTKDIKQISAIEDFIINVFGRDLLPEAREELMRKLERGRDGSMLNIVRNIRKEIADEKIKAEREGRKEGRKEGKREKIIEIIKNMLTLEQDEKTIMKFTKAKKEEIEEAKKELQMQAN